MQEYLDSLSTDELLHVRPDYWALRFGPGAAKRDYAGKALHPSHYNPAQPRVPAGNPDGGQWTLGVQVAADGHHYVPRSLFEKEKYSFRPETLRALEEAKTGPLRDPTSNRFDEVHRQYNKAVEEALDRYLERNNIRGSQMTPDQARTFADEVKSSRDPRIQKFNLRLWTRELNWWIRYGPRGRE